jgi:lipoprotein NlpI
MYYLRSQIEEALGNTKAQLADLGAAVAVDPKATEPYGWRIVYYLHHTQFKEALADYNQLVLLDPNAANYAQRSLLHLGLNQADAAKADAAQAIAANPDAPDGYLALAQYFISAHEFTDALERAEAAVQHAPQNVWALAMRGRVQILLKHDDQAAADLLAAQKLDQGNPAMLLGLAELAIQRDQLDPALESLTQWEGQEGILGWGYVLRAGIEIARKEPEKARQDLAKARTRALFPDEVAAADALAAKLPAGP